MKNFRKVAALAGARSQQAAETVGAGPAVPASNVLDANVTRDQAGLQDFGAGQIVEGSSLKAKRRGGGLASQLGVNL